MNESNVFGISVRAILAIIIVSSFCALAIVLKEVDLLKDLALIAVSFYFGQKTTQTSGGTNVQSDTTILPKPVSEPGVSKI